MEYLICRCPWRDRELIATELYDRAPSLARWLIACAVGRLPDYERDRYREEWLAHLNECPGKLGQLWHALGCLVSVPGLAKQLEQFSEARRGAIHSRTIRAQASPVRLRALLLVVVLFVSAWMVAEIWAISGRVQQLILRIEASSQELARANESLSAK
ncbi:MAG: hypothetical protein R3D62_15685 [Xanthobacteraceae bacterium]